MVKIKNKLEFDNSIYTAVETSDKLYVGGSNWNRRKILYNKKIAKNSKGILHIFNKNGRKFKEIKQLVLPSMIYSIVEISKNRLFIGCKLGKKSLNLIDSEGNIIKSEDDKYGDGVYNAEFNKKDKELLLTTRKGLLEVRNIKNLSLKSKLQLSNGKVRLWSLCYRYGKIYVGDYNGILYIINRKDFSIKKINLKSFYKGKITEKDFGPSLWGLEVLRDGIFLGTRWKDIFVLNKNLDLKKRIKLNEDITCLSKLFKDLILIGTRYGNLYSFNTKNFKLKKLTEIKPLLQKENAIWTINSKNNKALVCFADGYVVEVSK